MTIIELRREHMKELKELMLKNEEAVKNRLKEIHLDGLVRRKRDGKVGKLWVYRDVCRIEIKFHPLKKDGTVSVNASGYSFDIERDFEPYKESGTDDN